MATGLNPPAPSLEAEALDDQSEAQRDAACGPVVDTQHAKTQKFLVGIHTTPGFVCVCLLCFFFFRDNEEVEGWSSHPDSG